jgi:hypothetical protein
MGLLKAGELYKGEDPACVSDHPDNVQNVSCPFFQRSKLLEDILVWGGSDPDKLDGLLTMPLS